jgi:branched-chain amino acid transport system permease protein
VRIVFSPIIIGQVVVNGLSLSSIYILVALGFTLLFGIMRVVNFAHGEFAMLGGFGLFYLYGQMHLPFFVALPLAALIVAVGGLIFERLVFQWFYQKMFQSMIGLLGLSTAITFTAVIIWDVHERSIPPAFAAVWQVGGLFLPVARLVVFGISIVVLIAFYVFIRHTRAGLAMRAVAQDLEIAEAQGINSTRTYQQAFVVAIFMTALAGGLYGQIYFLSPFMGEVPLLKAFIVVILGGMGSIPGAAVGGLILGMSESFLSTYFGASVSSFVSFGVVILLLIFRPWGLMGTPES